MTQCSIRSELAGTVFRIEVGEGDVVAADDPVIVLESMKMEIPVLAPQAGRVLKFLVKVGDVVCEGQELAALEAA
jgi:urea carboxylase